MQIEEIEPNERRQHERRVLRGMSQLQFGKHPAMETRTMDVSISGLGIIAPVNPPARTQWRGGMGLGRRSRLRVRLQVAARPRRNLRHRSIRTAARPVMRQAAVAP